MDTGAYMANLKSCSNCRSNNLEVSNKITSEDDGVEVVIFERKFKDYNAVVTIL